MGPRKGGSNGEGRDFLKVGKKVRGGVSVSWEYVVEAVPGMSQGAFSACPAGGRCPRTVCGGDGESERAVPADWA